MDVFGGTMLLALNLARPQRKYLPTRSFGIYLKEGLHFRNGYSSKTFRYPLACALISGILEIELQAEMIKLMSFAASLELSSCITDAVCHDPESKRFGACVVKSKIDTQVTYSSLPFQNI
jgi:hypothetical protein